MTPLTPEQVEKLRLPEHFEFVPTVDLIAAVGLDGCGPITYEKWSAEWDGTEVPKGTDEIVGLALAIANGHLPPEALDDVWRRVEGKPSREAELLRELVEWYDAAVQAKQVADCYHSPPVTEEDHSRRTVAHSAAARFSEELAAARKWIEEQKP
jgi:hypothetical protein